MKASDETTSLLHASSSDVEADLEQPISPQPSEAEEPWTRTHKATVILAALFVICFQIADILRFTPSMRLYELGLCRRYYQQHDPSLISPDGHVAEQYCKISSIQEDLSALKGWMSTLEGLVGLILVLPYGALAEVKGAKLVAMLNLAGYALFCAWTLVVCFFWETLPIELVALAPLFRAVGGGAPVASAVTLAIVANAAPSSKRSTMFFFMGAAELVTEMIAPLMSTAFLAKGFIYTPILLGFIFEALAFVMIHAVPMDVIRQKGKDHSIERTESSQSLLGVSKAPEDRGGHFLSYLGDPRELLTRSIIILLGCFTVTKLGRQMLEMLVQYMSKRYGWSFAQANIAFSVRATGSLILLLAVLPLLKSRLQHYYQLHSDRTDFWIAFT
ncbi:MFS efflux pump-like protein [Elsinoe fawcettii]|nr:MFS efflux pump-like protein [Elsinoe fawcettii]